MSLRLCVVGGGRIGTIHLQNIQKNPRCSVAAFVDIDENRANEVKKETGCAIFTSINDVLNSNDISVDGFVICSPTCTHVEYSKLCISKGKPVLCEKPISMNPNEIKELSIYAKEQNVPLLCGYHRRHDKSFKKLQELVIKGDIGDIRTIRSCSRDNPIPAQNFLKISGGIMHDCASHDIDVIRWITQEEPCEVYASASVFLERIKEIDDWDTVSIHLKFPSGILATVDICRSAPYGYDQRIEVLGENGMLQAENQKPTTVIKSTAEGVLSDPNCFSFPQRYIETYAAELDHFIDIISLKVEPAVSGEDCYRAAVIIDLCNKSAKEGVPQKVTYE